MFSTKAFSIREIVMVGLIEKELKANHSHASQVSASRHIQHGGLISKVNHSCRPSCGISVNASGAHDFIAFRSIAKGEEITFDYAMRNYSIDFSLILACVESLNAENLSMDGRDCLQKRSLNTMDLLRRILWRWIRIEF